jgi:hypothetical protein
MLKIERSSDTRTSLRRPSKTVVSVSPGTRQGVSPPEDESAWRKVRKCGADAHTLTARRSGLTPAEHSMAPYYTIGQD